MILNVEEIEENIKYFNNLPSHLKRRWDKESIKHTIDSLEELLKYAKRIKELQEQNRWRDVNEELPEEDDDNILVSDKYGFCLIGNYSKINGFYAEDYKGNEICIKLWRPITSIKKLEFNGLNYQT